MSKQFLAPNFNGGLHAPHYFNGRLLAAEDLQADQRAVLARQSWLGKADGYGVIDGLMVTKVSETSVQITAGIGLNRQGQIIHLPSDINLSLLSRVPDQQPINDTGRFTPCASHNGDSFSVISAGAYLLTALPASHFEGQVPIKSVAGNATSSSVGRTAGCGTRWEVEGIQFKTIYLSDFDADSSSVSDNNRRNLLAHWCYGSVLLPDLALDPFHFPADFGGLDLLGPDDLTPCDLPLAVFYSTGSTLAFVDVWSARRRLVRPGALVQSNERTQPHTPGRPPDDKRDLPSPLRGDTFVRTWKGVLSDKRVAVAQARFLQFQEQVQALVDDREASTARAGDYFRFLPPACFLPIIPDITLWESISPMAQFRSYLQSLLQQRNARAQDLAQRGFGNLVNPGTNGFNLTTFLDKLPWWDGETHFYINGAVVPGETVDFTLLQSWYDEAIDLGHVGDAQPYLNVYFVQENVISPYDQLYVMLVKPHPSFVWAIPPQQGGG